MVHVDVQNPFGLNLRSISTSITLSQLLCGIILPWGQYVYGRLPQGCKPSSDIFQHFMSQLFADFSDVICFIDNICLFTKSTKV